MKDSAAPTGTGTYIKKYKYNLLNIGAVEKLIKKRWFPYMFQLATLLCFVLLIIIGWEVYPNEAADSKLFAKNNIVTLIVWGLWWPLMIIGAILLGRFWCSVCPIELVSHLSEKLSVAFRINSKNISKFMRGGAFILILYAVIQILISGVKIHRNPAYTSFFLLGLLSLAALTGFIYKDRAFCRAFCPAGILLNVYGRGGMLGIRVISTSVCTSCNSKQCITGNSRSRFDKRSCPSLINVPLIAGNKDCNLCLQCVKSCSKDNLALAVKPAQQSNVNRKDISGWSAVLFIMLVSGFVTSELSTEWKTAGNLFNIVPKSITSIIGSPGAGGFIESIWSLVLFPLLIWIPAAIVMKVFQKDIRFLEIIRASALPVSLIIAAGHLIKALLKLNSWIAYLPVKISSQSNNILKLEPILNSKLISLAGILILISAYYLSVKLFKDSGNKILNLLFTALFLFIVAGIGFLS